MEDWKDIGLEKPQCWNKIKWKALSSNVVQYYSTMTFIVAITISMVMIYNFCDQLFIKKKRFQMNFLLKFSLFSLSDGLILAWRIVNQNVFLQLRVRDFYLVMLCASFATIIFTLLSDTHPLVLPAIDMNAPSI